MVADRGLRLDRAGSSRSHEHTRPASAIRLSRRSRPGRPARRRPGPGRRPRPRSAAAPAPRGSTPVDHGLELVGHDDLRATIARAYILTDVDHSRHRSIDNDQSVTPEGLDVPSPARPQRRRPRRGRSASTPSSSPPSRPRSGPGYANFAIAEPPLKLVLIEGDGAARHAQPPRRRGRVDRRGRRGDQPGSPARAWPPRPRTRWRVATPCRTRSGSTAPTASRGRSTPSSPTSRCPPASSARWLPRRGTATRCAARPCRSPPQRCC